MLPGCWCWRTERWQNLTRPPTSSVREVSFTRWPRTLDSSEAGECRYVSCCRELMFPMRGTQSYVPTTFFFALKPAAVFIAQGGWAYLENITSSSEGCLCCPDKVHTTYQDYHVNIKAPTFLWWDEEARSVGLLLLSTLLNSSTRCCHHHYYSSKHASFIQAVILS